MKPGEAACKKSEESPGYVVCSDKKADLDAYKAGGADGVKALRDQMGKEMPGVLIDDSNIIALVEKNWISVATHPGLVVMTTMLPPDDSDTKELVAAVSPGPANTLRAVDAGSGFLWARVNPEVVKKEMGSELGALPPGIVEVLDGEMLLAGHDDPSAVALQFGITDSGPFEGLIALADTVKEDVAKGLPPVGGGTWNFEVTDVPVGPANAKAIHAGLTGVPEADVLASMTGLTLDTYAFAANKTVTLAVGASPAAIGAVAAREGDGPSPELRAYLPPELVTALDANQVSVIAHVPVDALQAPQTRNLIDVALKNESTVPADSVKAVLDMAAPLSSGTVWVTHADNRAQVHIAVQSIGHTADDEGKAALDAAAKVAEGGDPSASFSPLVTQFTASPRLASYRARAGDSDAALVASGVGAALATGVVMFPVFTQNRNEAIATELGVEPGAAEVAVQESVVEATEPLEEKKKKKKAKKKKTVAVNDPPPSPTGTEPTEPPPPVEDPKAAPPPVEDPKGAPPETKEVNVRGRVRGR